MAGAISGTRETTIFRNRVMMSASVRDRRPVSAMEAGGAMIVGRSTCVKRVPSPGGGETPRSAWGTTDWSRVGVARRSPSGDAAASSSRRSFVVSSCRSMASSCPIVLKRLLLPILAMFSPSDFPPSGTRRRREIRPPRGAISSPGRTTGGTESSEPAIMSRSRPPHATYLSYRPRSAGVNGVCGCAGRRCRSLSDRGATVGSARPL
mmetsp:Transcript_9259/g.22586  ORF Transcript_9259/g.22586 Transcript_9259/m.22586 type:complete len:207 (+) Transcript_9259:686-1306(+)